MEFVDEPELKATYEKCKYKVKCWEHYFKKKNGRLPSKLDIREAHDEIRWAYKTYFNLKSAALEKSFRDIDGFNSDDETTPNSSTTSINISSLESSFNLTPLEHPTEETKTEEVKNNKKTWGEHLNQPKMVDAQEDLTPAINISFTSKLFKNSSLSKRNPRKSLSFTHRKSETNLNSLNNSKCFSQPDVGQSFSQSESFENKNLTQPFKSATFSEPTSSFGLFSNVKMVQSQEPVPKKSINMIQSVLEENFCTKRNVDSGWLERIDTGSTKDSKINPNENNFNYSQFINQQNARENDNSDSDDIIDDSDEEESKIHFTKKRRTVDNSKEPILQTSNNFNEISTKQVLNEINNDTLINKVTNEIIVENNLSADIKMIQETEKSSEIANTTKPKPTKAVKAKKQPTKKAVPVTENVPIKRKSSRVHKTLIDIIEDDLPPDPFENDEENDSDFNPNGKEEKKVESEDEENEIKFLKKRVPKSAKPKQGRKKAQEQTKAEEEVEDENAPYELEFSVKPRFVTVPRNGSLKNITKKVLKSTKTDNDVNINEKDGKIKDRRQQDFEKLEKKIADGNLNENFVRLNLRKKVFVRGRKNKNFAKYKHQKWKAKTLGGPDMDMGGCDGGMLTCFNCGQIGHFGRNCKATKGDKLLPLSAVLVEDSPFPTLEEASKMAQESILAVRKSNKNIEDDSTDTNDEEDETNESFAIHDKLEDEGGSSISKNIETGFENKENIQNEENNDFFDDDDEELLAETLKLEEYVKKVDMQQYIDSANIIKPYYNLKDDGSLIDTPKEVMDTLRMFGHSNFRPGQEKAIMRILSGQSTLVTLSTGSGKSLCYQLPAYLYGKREPCISLIVSPLVSLMEDQVTGLPGFLRAACLHTNKTKVQRQKILEEIEQGDLHVLLVSPEAIVSGEKSSGFGSLLRKLPPIAFACIDEAHCVSQWSHNFRPSYLMICRILKERLGVQIILGLTATATCATSDSIISHLSVPDGRAGIISDTPLPDNLRLTVSKDDNRDHALLGLIMSDRFKDLSSIIIYCTRRQECERIATFLRTALKSDKPMETNTRKRKKVHVKAEPYHAGLSASRRRTIQNNFMRGDLRIVVATVAFGMGINKSDIRAVIHYNLPRNFESYVQEVGRAGRDGLPAHCHLFLDSRGNDENELQRHVFSDSIDRHVIRKLLEKVFIPCSCKKDCPKHEVAFSIEQTVAALDAPEENISTLLCYLELGQERHIEVLSPGYITCQIIAYGSAQHIRKAAKDCPPLAMALVLYGKKDDINNTFEFPVIEVAAAIGWDSGICKHKLKNLEWTTVNDQPKRSLLSVNFLNLGFRLLAPGNLTDEELDATLDSLHGRVKNQEETALQQLHCLHNSVTSVTVPTFRLCISDRPIENEIKLKKYIREYFNSEDLPSAIVPKKNCDEGQIVSDVRAILGIYRDNAFTGRSIARIFYGIQSPNYPAVIWGRCKFWRMHLNSDFHEICRIATREILRMR